VAGRVRLPAAFVGFAALVAVLALACLPRGRFHCDDDRQCTSPSGARGFCEAGGVCSFEDRACALGRRYARFTDEGGNHSGSCVDAQACVGTPVIEVAAGGAHACLRRLDGKLYCWGRNDRGQLGDGSFTPRAVPAPVAGLAGAARAVALGEAFTCAIDPDRRVACWGEGGAGQLGDVLVPRRASPAVVPGVIGALELALGSDFACARLGDGAVWCWGATRAPSTTSAPQLGRGGGVAGLAPAPVALPGAAVQVVAGADFACARLADGGVACWGHNEAGQLGVGDTESRAVPARVPGLADVVELAAGGAHTCALGRAGDLWCWGGNDVGQASPAGPAAVLQPAGVPGVVATRVRLGARHTCIVRPDETVACFGASDRDQLGPRDLAAPNPAVAGLGNVLELSVGGAFACALQRDTTVRCWGDDRHGQLGAGAAVVRARPSPVPAVSGVAALSAGAHGTCVQRAGEVACFGAATLVAAAGDASTPSPVRIPAGVVELAAGATGACARTLDRDVWCWGADAGAPRLRSGASAVDQISHGRAHACARARARALCWGENGFGQLGQPVPVGGFGSASADPAAVPVPGAVVEISTGDDHSCARVESGTVYCWGRGDGGQLGDGRTSTSAQPVAVALPEPARLLASGGSHSCARVESGAVYCWGRGDGGQLGDGARVDAPLPVRVAGLGAVEALALGSEFSCALAAGALSCWGAGDAGQLGAFEAVDTRGAPTPRPVPLASPITAVAAGGQHTCVLDGAGDLRCFGLDAHGQLGTGRLLSSAWPRPVALTCP
jgi:alpha-tubulin suppressor-like RCC1 family protein